MIYAHAITGASLSARIGSRTCFGGKYSRVLPSLFAPHSLINTQHSIHRPTADSLYSMDQAQQEHQLEDEEEEEIALNHVPRTIL